MRGGVEGMSEKTSSHKALNACWKAQRRRISAISTAVAAVTVLGACSGQTASSPSVASSPNSSVPATASSVPATATQPRSGAPSLSSRNIAPLIIEDVQPQFHQDHSFFTESSVPLSQQALTEMQTANSPNSPPSGMTIANQELISLTVAGNSADPVTINNMIIYKTCRKPPPGGTIFYSPTTGAGPFMTAPIYFNLDE